MLQQPIRDNLIDTSIKPVYCDLEDRSMMYIQIVDNYYSIIIIIQLMY